MITAVVTLDDLAESIADRQSELETLRQEYKARQLQLGELQRRKRELESMLHKVEKEMLAIAEGGKPRPVPVSTKKATETQTLPNFLVEIVRTARGPITVKAIADEVVRRKYPTTSNDIPNLVATRIRELIQKGALRRADGQPGVILGRSTNGHKTASSVGRHHSARSNGNGSLAHKPARKSKRSRRRKQPSLRSVLAELMAKAKRPIAVKDIEDQVLATGYRTKSKKFVDVLWVALGQMPNLENVPGKGYRLKKK